MSLIPLETKSSTVKLEIHESKLPRTPSSNHPHQLLVVSSMDESATAQRHAGECQSSPVWAWSTENWQQPLSFIFHSERFQNLHLLYLPATAQWLDLTPHCHLDHFQPPLNKPSSLYKVSPLFIHWVSKCDFLDLALTVYIHWASLNIRAEKYFLLLFLPFPNAPSETSILLWSHLGSP